VGREEGEGRGELNAGRESFWGIQFNAETRRRREANKVRQRGVLTMLLFSSSTLRLCVSAVNPTHLFGNNPAAMTMAEHNIAKIKISTAPFRTNTSVPTEARR